MANILKDYGERPKALRELLDQHHLEMVALSSGGVGITPGTENDEIARHLRTGAQGTRADIQEVHARRDLAIILS